MWKMFVFDFSELNTKQLRGMPHINTVSGTEMKIFILKEFHLI